MMDDVERVRGTITGLDRLRSSASANPRYMVTFVEKETGQTVSRPTEVDGQVGFIIPNSEYQGSLVDLLVSGQGQVIGVEEVA